jgi:hypothetical protein
MCDVLLLDTMSRILTQTHALPFVGGATKESALKETGDNE